MPSTIPNDSKVTPTAAMSRRIARALLTSILRAPATPKTRSSGRITSEYLSGDLIKQKSYYQRVISFYLEQNREINKWMRKILIKTTRGKNQMMSQVNGIILLSNTTLNY